MKRDDILLITIPFLLSAVIIFGHYFILSKQNPQVHSKPLITREYVEMIDTTNLKAVSPPQLPKQIIGVVHELPANNKQLKELFNLATQEQVNALILTLGLTIDAENNLIIPKAIESSEEMLLRWTKKTISEAHQLGLHTYLVFLFIEEPVINDLDSFKNQYAALIKRWASLAEEYHISFFNPGITIGHGTFRSLVKKDMQQLLTLIEQTIRKFYTGRIGIGLCCQTIDVSPRGYNQILVISSQGTISEEIKKQVLNVAAQSSVEHVFFLDLDRQRLTTLK